MTQIKAKVLFRFKTPNESIKATRKSSLNDGIKEVAEIKETMKSAREGVKSSLRQETRAARLLFGTSSNYNIGFLKIVDTPTRLTSLGQKCHVLNYKLSNSHPLYTIMAPI